MSDFNEAAEKEIFQRRFKVDGVAWSAWLARARLAHDENARLRAFARDVIREHQLETEGIQDLAVKHGLLTPVEATERCGEDCACAEYGDFPQTCYRMTSALAPKDGNDA